MSNGITELSWDAPDPVLVKGILQAEDGIAVLKDVNFEVPMISIKGIFNKIYGDSSLAERLNNVYPNRGIFKEASFYLQNVDQKVPFDLSPTRLNAIVKNDQQLVQDLGADFLEILSFYNFVQDQMITRLLRLTAQAIGGGFASKMKNKITDIHQEMNYNYRLVDYYPVNEKSQRCGEHRDYGTFTLIFQDGNMGGLELFREGAWVPIPRDAKVIFLWGWSATILSNGRIQAPLHRVIPLKPTGTEFAPRRNSAIFFVAPDLDSKLTPLLLDPSEKLAFNAEAVKNLTVREFKNLMGKRWRSREGTLSPDEEQEVEVNNKKSWAPTAQDDEINAYLQGTQPLLI